MTDVRIYQTNDGGEIGCVAGQLVLDDGLESSAFLSLFGGNDDDSGLEADEPLEWWGNKIEPDPERRYRSETQFLLDTLPLIPAHLVRYRDAAEHDLAWMVTSGLASSVTSTPTIPALNKLEIAIAIVIDDRVFQYVFTKSARARLQQ